MAFPDFSEFTFGYAIVRQIEEVLGGRTIAPSFPTPHEEAGKGYDVSILNSGIPLFIQFKRSEVMRNRSCREYKDEKAYLEFPIFRMHLHKSNAFKQHFLMQDLESSGNVAVYCTSAVEDKDELDALYGAGRIFAASTWFSPQEIKLPSLDEPHHVSFSRNDKTAWIYSNAGTPIVRASLSLEDVLTNLRQRREVPLEVQLDRLRRLVDDFDKLGSESMASRQRDRHGYTSREPGGQADADNWLVPYIPYPLEASELREERRRRTRSIESVVRRAAIEAFFEADALLVSVSRKALI